VVAPDKFCGSVIFMAEDYLTGSLIPPKSRMEEKHAGKPEILVMKKISY